MCARESLLFVDFGLCAFLSCSYAEERVFHFVSAVLTLFVDLMCSRSYLHIIHHSMNAFSHSSKALYHFRPLLTRTETKQ